MDTKDEILSAVKALICESGDYPEATYNLWFRDLKIESFTSDQVVLSVDSSLKFDIINERYTGVLEDYFEKVLGFRVEVCMDIVSDDTSHNAIIDLIDTELTNNTKKATIEESLEKDPVYLKYNPEYTFDNFIVGSTNKFAHAACRAIAQDPDHFYNPLFIHGSSGLGKTHLLYAITNEILKLRPGANVVYARGEDFTNELIASLSKKVPSQYFRDRYRKADVLLIDDIQFIAGKPSTQEEFFHTFNTLHEEKKQIILASDRPPKDIPYLEERLISRFSSGLMVDVQPPDLELRIAILKAKAQQMNFNVDDDIILYIADNIKSNIRELEGAIKRLRAVHMINDVKITLGEVKQTLKDYIEDNMPTGITINKIFETVADFFSVSVEDMCSRKRQKEFVTPRHITIYILRTITDLSLNDIGKYFSLDHSTVLSALNKVSANIKVDPKLDYDITKLISEIKK